MINAARVIAVLFALLTFMQNFQDPKVVENTLGTGFVAVTFAILSLSRGADE